ncbi:MAG: beta-propeller fold lactonase family protein [Terracidiphilus sp.]
MLWTIRAVVVFTVLMPGVVEPQDKDKASEPGAPEERDRFVYVNDDLLCLPDYDCPDNFVSAFAVAPDGTLNPIKGSPFDTGGTGGGGWFYASNRISVSTVGEFLFAGNSSSQNVSAFKIDPKTGVLTPVSGSPFATDAPSTFLGMAVSPTPDGKFLMVADAFAVTVFRISRDGALSRIENSPFPTLETPNAVKVTPDGKFVAVSEPALQQIEMFRIGHDGSLASLGGFPAGGGGDSDGIDIDCSSRFLYSGEGTYGDTTVDVYRIEHNGSLTPIAGSPFTPGVGVNSSVVLLSADNKQLFVSNQTSNTITVFDVDRDGGLSLHPGSPFAMNGSAWEPAGMATSKRGNLLYVADLFPSGSGDSAISVFRVGETGTLTEVEGSPFARYDGPGGQSLTAYPSKHCLLPLDTRRDGREEDRQSDQEQE